MKNFSTYNFFFQPYFAYLDYRFEHAGTTVRAAVASLSHTHTDRGRGRGRGTVAVQLC